MDASAGMFPAYQQSMAETNVTGMTQATTNRSIEETEKKQKARIELLEKKVRAKD